MFLKNLFLLGDIGFLNNNLKFCVNNIKQSINKNDIIVLLGDNFYPSGLNSDCDAKIVEFNEIFKDIHNPIYSILGNHDYLINPHYQINHSSWIMDDFYYVIQYTNIDLYFIDSVQFYIDNLVSKQHIEYIHNNSIENLTNNQINWLINNLKINVHKPKIIFGHYPLITNGFYNNKTNKLYNLLIHIFNKYNVKAYISGHEHNIQYIKHNLNNYVFKQVIIGSSSENRFDKKIKHEDMYDNLDIYYGQLIFLFNQSIILNYVNKYGKIKYTYNL